MSELSTPNRTSPGRRPVSPYRRHSVGHEVPRIGQLLEPATRAAQRWRDADNDLTALTDFYRQSRELITRRRQQAERDIRNDMTVSLHPVNGRDHEGCRADDDLTYMISPRGNLERDHNVG